MVELYQVIAAGPNDVFEGRMNLTALYKEQIYMGKKKKKKEKKAGKKKKKKALPLLFSKSLPFALILLLLLVSFCPYYARAYTGKKNVTTWI